MNFNTFFKKTSPATFTQEWHQQDDCQFFGARGTQQDCESRDPYVPPSTGKNTTVAERYPAYHFARDPLSHVLLCSYSDDLAVFASGNCRQIVQGDRFQENFPYPVGKATEARWQFAVPGQDGRYSYVASGIAGGITGHTAVSLVVIQ